MDQNTVEQAPAEETHGIPEFLARELNADKDVNVQVDEDFGAEGLSEDQPQVAQ